MLTIRPRGISSSDSPWRRPLSDITSLHVILSLRCNYRCEFCFQPNFKDTLPDVVWRTKLAPVYPGLQEVVLHGGEPTAVPAFVEMAELIRSRSANARFCIFTNGLRFSGYWWDLMLARGSYVNFSLNAATRATYAAVNRGDHLDEVLDLARQFRSAVDQAGSTVRVDFSFVVTPRNVGEIADFIVLAADSRAHRVRFFFDLDQLPSEDEVRRAFVSADRTRRLFPLLPVTGLELLAGRLFGTEVPADCLQSAGCRRTFHNLYVGVNGDVSFCNRLNWSPIGNIVGSELDEIWNSTVALEQRRAQAEGEWTFCSNASCGPTDRVWASRPDHPRLPARFARVE